MRWPRGWCVGGAVTSTHNFCPSAGVSDRLAQACATTKAIHMTILSAANIRIAKKPDSDLFERLRALDRSSEPNKNDRAIILITALIGEGISTREQIIAVLTQVGFHRGHIAIVLAKESGSNPVIHRWQHDANGRYSLHD